MIAKMTLAVRGLDVVLIDFEKMEEDDDSRGLPILIST
jgi:hypothetical protein